MMRKRWVALDVAGNLWEFDPADGAPDPDKDPSFDLSAAHTLIGDHLGPGHFNTIWALQVAPEALHYYVNPAHLICWWVIEKEDR